MIKLLLAFLVFMFLFMPQSAFAASSFSVRVSFTIPQSIEIGKDCSNDYDEEKQQAEEPTKDIAQNTTLIEQTILNGGKACLMQTVLPK